MFKWIKQDKRIVTWTPVILWGSLILVLSVVPFKVTPSLTIGYFDKIAHFFEFAVFSITYYFNKLGIRHAYCLYNMATND